MRRAFTLLEVMSATLIMGIIVVISFQSVNYMNFIHQQNEIHYLALNRLDSEMSRLVMAYSEHKDEPFYDETYYTNSTEWNQSFEVKKDFNTSSNSYIIYKSNSINGLKDNSYGLKISTSSKRNLVQIKSISGNNNIVALLGWRIKNNINDSNISINLSMTYPYIYDGTDIKKLWNFIETKNLKSSIKF